MLSSPCNLHTKPVRLSHSVQPPPPSCTTTNSRPRRPQVNNIISRPIPHMGQGNYKLCMSSRHATSITHTCAHTCMRTLGDTPLRSPTTLHTFPLFHLSPSLYTPPSLHVILCHSPCAKLHWGELPQYWGIVSYTGNFLPRCQAYFTLICLQRLLIKQSCLYTYLYRSPARATLHTALDSSLLNIYLHWMSTEEE